MADILQPSISPEPDAIPPITGTTITQTTIDQMTNVLDSLLSHTHVFYDDYGTACNCNCNCNCTCTRGGI